MFYLNEYTKIFHWIIVQVWDGCSDALITFNHDNFIGDVSYIVENDVLLHSVLKELEPFSNITIRNEANIERISLEKDGLPCNKVQLNTGEDFSAELLVNINFIHFWPFSHDLYLMFVVQSAM